MKVMRGSLMVTLLLYLGMVVTGCTHPLTVKNIAEFQGGTPPMLAYAPSIGVVFDSSAPEAEQLLDEVVSGLMSQGQYADIKPRYVPNSASAGLESDLEYVVHLRLSPKYHGSIANFFISWPGFILFTPAWHGFVYKHDYTTEVQIQEAATGRILDSFTIPVNFDIRHADMNRTWIEISWLEYGVIAFVGGLFWTMHDGSIKNPVRAQYGRIYGNHVARKITEKMAYIN